MEVYEEDTIRYEAIGYFLCDTLAWFSRLGLARKC